MLKETKAYLAWIKYDLDIISYVLTWKIMLTRVYVFYYNCIACHKSYTFLLACHKDLYNLRCDKTFINILYSRTHSLASTYTLILKSTTEQRWNQQYPLILHHSTNPFTTYVSPPTKQLPHHTTTSQQIHRIYSLLTLIVSLAHWIQFQTCTHTHPHIDDTTRVSLPPWYTTPQHHNTTSSLHHSLWHQSFPTHFTHLLTYLTLRHHIRLCATPPRAHFSHLWLMTSGSNPCKSLDLTCLRVRVVRARDAAQARFITASLLWSQQIAMIGAV